MAFTPAISLTKISSSACNVIQKFHNRHTAKQKSSVPISAANCGGLKTPPWFHEFHKLNVSALFAKLHSYRTKARTAYTAPVPATENRRRYIMTTNKAIIDKLLRYQTVMSWVRSLLSQAIITKAEYAKIDTRIAQKYGISSCSIFRWKPRKIVDLRLDRR